MADVTMPQLGETVTEGTITKWFKKVGDPVAADEPLFEVSTDKVDTEVPSPTAGFVTEIRVHEGDTVDVGAVIAVISADAGARIGDARAARRCACSRLPSPNRRPPSPKHPRRRRPPAPAPEPAPAPRRSRLAAPAPAAAAAAGTDG